MKILNEFKVLLEEEKETQIIMLQAFTSQSKIIILFNCHTI